MVSEVTEVRAVTRIFMRISTGLPQRADDQPLVS
jgi:hypothetical protein